MSESNENPYEERTSNTILELAETTSRSDKQSFSSPPEDSDKRSLPSPSEDLEKQSETSPPDNDVPPKTESAPPDPNVVDWDGPDDPANPQNWKHSVKLMNVALLSLSVLSTNISTTMFAPGANQLASDFGIAPGSIVQTLCVTMPSLGASAGPLLFAPLSEVIGRVWIYRVTSILFLGCTVACALSVNTAMFLIFRFLSGVCSASFLTCGGGTIADVLPKERRGTATAVFTSGPLLGPVVGPVVGGFIVQNLSWRWTFWVVLMLGGVIAFFNVLLMRETNAKTLLERKTKRLQKETGNMDLVPAKARKLPARTIMTQALVRPLKMLTMSPIVLFISIYLAFVFGLTYLLFATFPDVFESTYGWSVAVSGLAYLGLGFGCVIGVITVSKLSDKLLREGGGPERRLLLMMWSGPCIPIALFWYGWSTDAGVQFMVPIIGTAFVGIGVICITSSGQLYMMDTFGAEGAASALAAVTFVRNSSGAFLALAAPPLYSALGLGWGNSVLAFIAIAFMPIPFLFYRWGHYLRERFPVKL